MKIDFEKIRRAGFFVMLSFTLFSNAVQANDSTNTISNNPVGVEQNIKAENNAVNKLQELGVVFDKNVKQNTNSDLIKQVKDYKEGKGIYENQVRNSINEFVKDALSKLKNFQDMKTDKSFASIEDMKKILEDESTFINETKQVTTEINELINDINNVQLGNLLNQYGKLNNLTKNNSVELEKVLDIIHKKTAKLENTLSKDNHTKVEMNQDKVKSKQNLTALIK